MGIGDHHCHEGQYRICCEKTRDKHDRIIVQEKVDGTNVAAAKVGGKIIALLRAGYLASSSPFEQHHLFADWVALHWRLFDALLEDGERVCGEWLAQAHGTRYELPASGYAPFVAFDMFCWNQKSRRPELRRLTVEEFKDRLVRLAMGTLTIPRELHNGAEPFGIDAAKEAIQVSGHGALDPVEGAVWRVERQGEVDFLAKWVRPDKVDGSYLPKNDNGRPVWNWRP